MDNQHRMIKGYRDLSQEEIELMNMIKERGNDLGDFIDRLSAQKDIEFDPRWLAIAKTDLQKGFMALVRAVAKPAFF